MNVWRRAYLGRGQGYGGGILYLRFEMNSQKAFFVNRSGGFWRSPPSPHRRAPTCQAGAWLVSEDVPGTRRVPRSPQLASTL